MGNGDYDVVACAAFYPTACPRAPHAPPPPSHTPPLHFLPHLHPHCAHPTYGPTPALPTPYVVVGPFRRCGEGAFQRGSAAYTPPFCWTTPLLLSMAHGACYTAFCSIGLEQQYARTCGLRGSAGHGQTRTLLLHLGRSCCAAAAPPRLLPVHSTRLPSLRHLLPMASAGYRSAVVTYLQLPPLPTAPSALHDSRNIYSCFHAAVPYVYLRLAAGLCFPL